MISALVPVKAPATAKSRLVPPLGRELAQRLALAMMEDVIEALCHVPELARVVVVTPDADVARAAVEAGAEVLQRPDPGLNEAIEAGASELAREPGDGVLVVLGDVAAAQPADLARLLAANTGHGVVLAPSSDGGTSALLRVPHDVIPACFGPDSAARHREAASRAGVPCCELVLPSLSLDVDVHEDLQRLVERGPIGRRTRAALERTLEGSQA